MKMDPQELLKAYAENGSEEAFRELVTRFFGLVYATALRLVGGDAHRAEDVAQMVFADLARQARTISPKVMLGGWLHQRVFNVASTWVRGERRRQAREQKAVAMSTLDNDEIHWGRIAPILDQAIHRLNPEDRTAIVARFFERRDLHSLGVTLGISADAAQKRVSRALDKLRQLLAREGVTLSASTLGAALAAEALTAAPPALAGSIAAAALASAAGSGATATGLLATLIMSKFKLAIINAVLLLSMSGVILHQHRANTKLRDELGKMPPGNSATQSLVETPITPATAASLSAPDASAETLRLRGQIGVMNQELASLRGNRTNLVKVSKMLRNQVNLDQFPDSHALIHSSKATNAGIATPAALLQTWLWAQRQVDGEGLYNTADYPEGTSEADKLAEVNRRAEEILGRDRTNTGEFEDYRLAALYPIGDDFYLAAFHESTFAQSHFGLQFFHKTSEGWKITNYTPEQGAFLRQDGRWMLDWR